MGSEVAFEQVHTKMGFEQEQWYGSEMEPVSPTGQYFNSSVLSICVLGVLESEVPIDDSQTMTLLKDVFLPINPRFSSIMVTDKNGLRQWKKVEVKLEKHVNIPEFPSGLSPKAYDDYLSEYLTNIGMEKFPETQPLWSIHIIKYQTSNAGGVIVFKLHHALGDGFSLMGALLSCLQTAKNHSLPLRFPKMNNGHKIMKTISLPKMVSLVFNSVSDFGWSLLKSSVVEDDHTPIRSGNPGLQFLPVTISTMSFPLDHIKQIKTKLGVSINDVITGTIFLGTRLYMEAMEDGSRTKSSTALVLLNTRMVDGYKCVKDMVEPDAESPWGNQFGFLHVSVPELSTADSLNPLEFIRRAHQTIKAKRSSLAVPLTGRLLELLRKYTGPETTAKHIRNTLSNSSMTVSNMIGPVDQMSLADHPIRGLYFMVVGVPQSLTITMISYMGELRVAIGSEKGFIVPHKYKSCIENAFQMILQAV